MKMEIIRNVPSEVGDPGARLQGQGRLIGLETGHNSYLTVCDTIAFAKNVPRALPRMDERDLFVNGRGMPDAGQAGAHPNFLFPRNSKTDPKRNPVTKPTTRAILSARQRAPRSCKRNWRGVNDIGG
jgi:hypothetical protein